MTTKKGSKRDRSVFDGSDKFPHDTAKARVFGLVRELYRAAERGELAVCDGAYIFADGDSVVALLGTEKRVSVHAAACSAIQEAALEAITEALSSDDEDEDETAKESKAKAKTAAAAKSPSAVLVDERVNARGSRRAS